MNIPHSTCATGSAVPLVSDTTAERVDSNIPKYRHKPFPDKGDWIRVLHLCPSHGGRIKFTLKQVEHTKYGYQALSYAWGHLGTFSHAVVIDAATEKPVGKIPLTKNLTNALRDLEISHNVGTVRTRAYVPVGCFPAPIPSVTTPAWSFLGQVFHTGLTLWIDQICIDQETTEEKNHQVSMMSSIYSNASRVITYFGPACEDRGYEESGMQILGQLYEEFATLLDYLVEDISKPYQSKGSLWPNTAAHTNTPG